LIPLLVAWGAVLANGGIVTDGTVGTAGHLGAPQALSGSDVKITQDMGTTAGHNVFQSFKEFNIGSGQSVTFTENSAGFVNNIIARVTGKDTSNINGTLSVTPGGHANFYLLNPNGVIFGHGAQIDVPGDFHVTTAHFIKFQDGAKYGADPVHSHLSTTEPASFGFSSGTHSNNVLIDVTDGAQLKNPTTPNTAIDLVAQNIKIENGATVSANDVRLVAAKGDTSVSLSHDVYGNLLLPKFAPAAANAGKVLIQGNDTTVTSDGDGGGRVAMWGGGIKVVNGTLIDSVNTGDTEPSSSNGISIIASTLRMENGGVIKTDMDLDKGALGHDAGISIHSGGGVSLLSESILSTLYGPVNISARNVSFFGQSDLISHDIIIKSARILSLSNSGLAASGGNVNLQSDYILLSNEGSITASTDQLSVKGGNIYIYANHGIALRDLSFIFGIGGNSGFSDLNNNGNRISIHDQGGLFVAGGSQILTYKDDAPRPQPQVAVRQIISASEYGGEIDINARYLYLDHGYITAYTTSNGGSVRLENLEQIFAIGGRVNGFQYYSSGYKSDGNKYIPDGYIKEYTGPHFDINNPPNENVENTIAVQNNGGGGNVSIIGSIFNLSGAMSNLPPVNFKSKEITNSCEAANTGSLSLTGKGRTSSKALDRLIYGY
jgi:filamentous hemagglutinin family protein